MTGALPGFPKGSSKSSGCACLLSTESHHPRKYLASYSTHLPVYNCSQYTVKSIIAIYKWTVIYWTLGA